MKRDHGDHLSDDDKVKLYRDLRLGYSTAYLARTYNIAERTVCIHRCKMNGTHFTERDVRRDNTRICLVNECYTPILEGSSFCAKHDPQPHPNRARLMAGRA